METLKERFHQSIDEMMDMAKDTMEMANCQLHETLPMTDYFRVEIDGVERFIKLEISVLH